MLAFVNDMVPHLYYAGRIQKQAGEHFDQPLHHHPEWTELVLVTEGSGTYQVQDTCYTVHPQSLVIYNPGVWHKEQADNRVTHEMLFLACTRLHLAGLTPGAFIEPARPVVHPLGEKTEDIERWFRLIVAESARQSSPGREAIADYLLAIVLTELSSLIHTQPVQLGKSRSAQSIARVRYYIHEHYREAITLATLSDITHLTPFHLSRTFKTETGLSPIHYLIHYRVEVAKQYLTTTDETVGMIAERVGYESTSHFQSAFKKSVGISPGQYRNHKRLEGQEE